MGIVTGPIFDRGYYRSLLVAGSFLTTFGIMMLSFSTEYYQVLLSHGICVGLGGGILFVPSVALVAAVFTSKRSVAMGIVTSGGSIGKHCPTKDHPLVLIPAVWHG